MDADAALCLVFLTHGPMMSREYLRAKVRAWRHGPDSIIDEARVISDFEVHPTSAGTFVTQARAGGHARTVFRRWCEAGLIDATDVPFATPKETSECLELESLSNTA